MLIENLRGLQHQFNFDVVVFTGGSDVSPDLYGAKAHKSTRSHPPRDKTEKIVYNMCLDNGVPMVGICRGAQFLTVMNGGKLVQDVTNHAIGGMHPIRTSNDEYVQVSSTHHQMMIPMGNFELLAYAEGMSQHYDGLSGIKLEDHFERIGKDKFKEPEVVWYPDTRSLAVQYHPEYMGVDTGGWMYFQDLLEEYIFS